MRRERSAGLLRDRRGMTLMELLAVVAIMGILFGIAGLSWKSMRDRYEVEKQAKEIYADMINTRMRAVQRDRAQFVIISSAASATMYRVFDDGPLPNGDGTFLNAATDPLVSTYNLLPSYSMVLSSPALTMITFSSKGLVGVGGTGSIRITPSAGGEYDCVSIDQIKTGMGIWNGTTNICDVK